MTKTTGLVGRSVRHGPTSDQTLVLLTRVGKHTSVTKEASKAIKDLKNKRKLGDERAARRVSTLDESRPGGRLALMLKMVVMLTPLSPRPHVERHEQRAPNHPPRNPILRKTARSHVTIPPFAAAMIVRLANWRKRQRRKSIWMLRRRPVQRSIRRD